MAETAAMNGAEWLARALASTGMTHVFFVESTMRRTLLALDDLGVKPILAHSEKAAAYMADGYARIAMHPGICMAQSRGARNRRSNIATPTRRSLTRPSFRRSPNSRLRSIQHTSCRVCCVTPGVRRWPTR